MKQMIEAILEDLSTREVFLFRIACASCGAEYANRPTRFSKADVTPATQAKKTIYDAIYDQEHRAARLAALQMGTEYMNYCPICKRMVCNQCFLICDDLDMCRQCAEALQEKGNPVEPIIVDAVI